MGRSGPIESGFLPENAQKYSAEGIGSGVFQRECIVCGCALAGIDITDGVIVGDLELLLLLFGKRGPFKSECRFNQRFHIVIDIALDAGPRMSLTVSGQVFSNKIGFMSDSPVEIAV